MGISCRHSIAVSISSQPGCEAAHACQQRAGPVRQAVQLAVVLLSQPAVVMMAHQCHKAGGQAKQAAQASARPQTSFSRKLTDTRRKGPKQHLVLQALLSCSSGHIAGDAQASDVRDKRSQTQEGKWASGPGCTAPC